MVVRRWENQKQKTADETTESNNSSGNITLRNEIKCPLVKNSKHNIFYYNQLITD